jgi:hypothetical protein
MAVRSHAESVSTVMAIGCHNPVPASTPSGFRGCTFV